MPPAWKLIVVLACGLAASCGRAPAPESATAQSSDHRRDYPAVQFVPADASYALVAARLRDAASAARELVTAVGLVVDEDIGSADRELRSSIGVSWLSEPDLTRIGLDPDGGVALFSRGIYPTAIARVADADKLRAFLAANRPQDGVTSRRFAGHEVFTWIDDGDAVSWVLMDDWFAVRLYAAASDPDPVGWVARLQADARAPGLAGSAELAAALAAAHRRLPPPAPIEDPLFEQPPRAASPGVIGLVRVDRVLATMDREGADMLAPCRAALADDAMIVVAADMSLASGEGVIEIPLAAGPAAALRGALAPPPPPGFAQFAADAAIHLELGVDLAWLSGLASSGCPVVPPLPGRVRARLGVGRVTGYRLAASAIRPAERRARIAVQLTLRDAGFVRELLDRIPMRNQLETTARIGGQEVVVLAVPLFPRLTYRLTEGSLLAAAGDGLFEQLIAEGPAEAGGRTVIAAALRPDRIPEQAELFEQLARAAGLIGHRFFRRTETRLSRYEMGRVRLSLEGDGLVLRAGMRAR